jgi:predicted acyltransferase
MLQAQKNKMDSLNRFHVRNKALLSKDRVLSIDALRGFDMFWIIGGHPVFVGLDNVFHNKFTGMLKLQLDHSQWVGFTFYDIIMPLFLFLVGVSMVFSYRKRLGIEKNDKSLWKHTVKRVLILWVLGMIVQGQLLTYDIDQIQLYSNTLQAIASGYLIATFIVLYQRVSYQVVTTIGLMLAYWVVVALVPIGGTTQGAYTVNGNVPLYFDHLILGRFHDGLEYTWIISSLNFAATTMLGVFSGYIMQSQLEKKKKFWCYILLGVSLICLGLIWNTWHPIIKKIWTGSFVLFSGGICILLLAAFYLLIDIWNIKKITKWMIIIGSNAIFAYVAWHLFERSFTAVSAVFIDGLKPYIAGWYHSILYFGSFMVLFLLLRYLYRNKVFIKI